MNIKFKYFIRSLFILIPIFSLAQEKKNSFEVYGFILVDGGYNFNTIDPEWFDVMRPTKLPKYQNQFAPSGNYFISVRQTRVGVRSLTKTPLGELKTQFDFDLYGFGKDAGQTTLHVVNAFGQLGKFIAGQTPSTFMDTDVFPVTLDYWGPNSRVFFLNIQLRYTPVYNDKQRFAIALERPGATADRTDYSNSIDIQNVRPRLPFPNLVIHYRRIFNWGHIQIAGILKSIQWKDTSTTSSTNLSGKDMGWGVNMSTVINATKQIRFKFQGIYGEGCENYVADPSPDIALQTNPGNLQTPAKGKALPIKGFLGFVELDWTEKVRSSAGYSMMAIENADLQSPDAFHRGQYGLINLRYYPVQNVMAGIEYQFGKRNNFYDGFSSTGNKIQFSFKINFSQKVE